MTEKLDKGLVEKQRDIHIGKTERNRTLKEYDKYLGRSSESNTMLNLLESIIAQKGSVVWADIGCGNGVALRQAKRHLLNKGYFSDQMKFYGVDALPVKLSEVAKHANRFPDLYPVDLIDRKFNPKIIAADATRVKLPEEPDIVTAIEVVQYTEDPVAMIRNLIGQVNEKGYVGLSSLQRLEYTSDQQATDDPDNYVSQRERSLRDHLEVMKPLSDSQTTREPDDPLPDFIEGFRTQLWGEYTILLQKMKPDAQFPDFRLVRKYEISQYGREEDPYSYIYLYTDR